MVENGRDLLRSSSPISVVKQLHVVLDWVLCISTDEDSTNCMSKILKCLIFLTKKQKQQKKFLLFTFFLYWNVYEILWLEVGEDLLCYNKSQSKKHEDQ